MNKLSLLTAIIAFTVSAFSQANTANDWDRYENLATTIAVKINSAPLAQLTQQSIELVEISTKIIPSFIAKHPVCKNYLTAALEASTTMTSLSIEEIERDYHSDGKLPPMKSASCYHAKDLLVHPATMAVIGKTQPDSAQTRQQIHRELAEVLEHFNQVKMATVL
ncbi:hypothetical protein LP316_09505 [Thalassotalea sp. LPB0316]|uniref:hypothetical protein n=1 Tax=Thalassotalea sp. LPB0316 TaxID=2769490 RepID=UPI0018667C36|nr:hypothetical protein [Thalassotalea sp. LPB0316]QOL24590.1 hypothetical protein LP316_09505 [Thalassotalea sp. LPB0316]